MRDWMRFTITGPPEGVEAHIRLAAEQGLEHVDWCVMEHPGTLALAEYAPAPPRELPYYEEDPREQ